MLLNILKDPNPILRQVALDVSKEEIKNLQPLLSDLKETMIASDGVGIAAPQVNVSKRIIVVEMQGQPTAFINPQIVGRSLRKVNGEEGCLSVPGIYGIVKRHKAVRMHALNEEGQPVELNLKDLPAIIFQHEIDHLDGVLFIDRVIRYTGTSKL